MSTPRQRGWARQLVTMMLLGALVAACGSSGGDEGGPTWKPTGGTTSTSGCTYDGDLKALLECVKSGDPVAQAEVGAAAPESNIQAASANEFPYTVQEYLTYIIEDLDRVWTKWFTDHRFAEPYVGIELIGPGDEPYVSRCTDEQGQRVTLTDDFKNAFYCPLDEVVGADGVVYKGAMLLPVTTFQQMWTGDIFGRPSTRIGDFGAAIITAHEFGHHVQDELMLQHNAAVDPDLAAPTGQNKELIADCFAGVWVASAYYSGLLTDTDFHEGIAALEAIGDFTGSHGTPQERHDAMIVGYHGIPGTTAPGDPLACVQTYWR